MIKSYSFYFLVFLALIYQSQNVPFLIINLLVQMFLFIFMAAVPAYKTKRMSYVDLAWPFGLMAIGILLFTYVFVSDFKGDYSKAILVACLYLAMGLRMGLGAFLMFLKGHFKVEFPRYLYHRQKWAKESAKFNEDYLIQREIFIQAAANSTVLFIPAFLCLDGPLSPISKIEIFGAALWLLSFSFESMADFQKIQFIKKNVTQNKNVCKIGLWKYCRHPNYFGEWMCWNSLIVISFGSRPSFVIALGLLSISKIMYDCLVYYTGATPAEHFSLLKRPDYEDYINRTNQFFPWPKKSFLSLKKSPILFFDSTCGLCQRSVQFILKNEQVSWIRFSPLEGELAKRILTDPGVTLNKSVIFYDGEQFYFKSNAVLKCLSYLKFPWRLTTLFFIIPSFFRDFLYDIVANRRRNFCFSPNSDDAYGHLLKNKERYIS